MSGIAPPGYIRMPRRRRDQIWLAVIASVLVHVLLFLAISLFKRPPAPPPPPPMEVTIADEVGPNPGSPNTKEEPAESKAPDIAPPEDSPPPEASPAKAEPAPPALAPAVKAAPVAPSPAAKPQPVKPAPVAAPAKASPKAVTAPSKPAAAPGKGNSAGNAVRRPGGLTFNNDYFKGGTARPSTGTATQPKGPVMTPQAAADIGGKILQQVQPCANRQINPGPGANRIKVSVRLHINRDGTLASRPTIEGSPTGVDDDNARYLQRVKDAAIATFMGCQPLRGLPLDYYDIPNGWSNFVLRYKLPG